MNHQKIYDNIIQKAKSENRQKLKKTDINYIYYENHHILPKCLSGDKEKENMVLLTVREHFICHKLLTYIFKGNYKIVYGYYRMIHSKNGIFIKSSRDYAYLKELISNTPMPDEIRKKISKSRKGKPAWNKGIPASRESKLKNRESQLGDKSKCWGKHHSEETLQKLRKPKSSTINMFGNKNGLNYKHTAQAKAKISSAGRLRKGVKSPNYGKPAWNKGKHSSEKTKIKISNFLKGRTAWNKGVPCSKESKIKQIETKRNKKI